MGEGQGAGPVRSNLLEPGWFRNQRFQYFHPCGRVTGTGPVCPSCFFSRVDFPFDWIVDLSVA